MNNIINKLNDFRPEILIRFDNLKIFIYIFEWSILPGFGSDQLKKKNSMFLVRKLKIIYY